MLESFSINFDMCMVKCAKNRRKKKKPDKLYSEQAVGIHFFSNAIICI